MTLRDQYEHLFWDLVGAFERALPGFRVAYKHDNFASRVVGALVFPLNPLYMIATTSTWGRVVRFPDPAYLAADPRYCCEVLVHEFAHAWDKSRGGWWRWWAPQALALISLAAVAGLWWRPAVGALAFLAFALPWRSSGRAQLESRGFGASIAFQLWTQGQVPPRMRGWIADQLSGPALYWPARRAWAEAEIATWVHRIQDGSALFGEPSEPLRILRRVLEARAENGSRPKPRREG